MFDDTLGDDKLTRVFSEKDLGVSTSATLSWELHVNTIISKANKILGVLRRTCINLTDRCIRRTLYISLVKSQLVKIIQLSRRVDRVQRRATKWIMMNGELNYKERLLTLNMLPLTLDWEIKDLVFMYKAFFGFITRTSTITSRLSATAVPDQVSHSNTFSGINDAGQALSNPLTTTA